MLARLALASGGLLPLLALVALLACGRGPSSSYDGRVYREGPRIGFVLGPVPSGWRRVDDAGAALAFRDDASSATVVVNARCKKTESATPLVALRNQLVMGSTAREVLAEELVPFDGREALHTHLRARWDGVPMDHDIFVLSKDGCVYDFVWFGPPASHPTGAPGFQAFTRTFRTLPGTGAI